MRKEGGGRERKGGGKELGPAKGILSRGTKNRKTMGKGWGMGGWAGGLTAK